MLCNLGNRGMAAEDGPWLVAVPYRWDQCFIPHGTGARERCMRPERHNGATRNGVVRLVPSLEHGPGAARGVYSGRYALMLTLPVLKSTEPMPQICSGFTQA
jgi:hypothetical protein